MRATPRLLTVTVPTSVPVSLYDLLAAIDSQTETHAQALQLQVDPLAGGDLVYVGNSDLNTVTRWGVQLQAGQVYPLPSMSSNLLLLQQIYLATSGADTKVGVMIVTR